MLSIVIILLTVFLLGLFVIGLIQCRKYSFKAGFYFFAILLVHTILSFIYPPFIRRYIDSYFEGNNSPPMGMTIGELVGWFCMIPRIIEAVAFSILVVGLYRMWKSKTIKS